MAAGDYERLARFYDAIVQGGADLPFFVEQARRAGGPVLELMAGTGRVSLAIARAGVPIVCVDASAAMLEVLRREAERDDLPVTVVHQDVLDLHLPDRFALIFIAFHSFAELPTPGAGSRALRRVREHLAPGGLFLCTLQDPMTGRRLATGSGAGVRTHAFRDPESGRDLVLIVQTEVDEETSEVVGTERVEVAESGEILVEFPLRYRLYEPDEFQRLAEGAGFVVDAVHGGFEGEEYQPGRSATLVWWLRGVRSA